MEEEIKELKKSVESLTKLVENLTAKSEKVDADFEALKQKSIENQVNTKSLIDAIKGANTSAQKDEKADWTFLDYSKKSPSELADMEKTNPERYKKLLNDYLKAK